MEKKRAVGVNVKKGELEEVSWETFEDLQRYVGNGEIAYLEKGAQISGSVLLVSERRKESDEHFVLHNGRTVQPYYGNGIVVGVGDNFTSCGYPLSMYEPLIVFPPRVYETEMIKSVLAATGGKSYYHYFLDKLKSTPMGYDPEAKFLIKQVGLKQILHFVEKHLKDTHPFFISSNILKTLELREGMDQHTCPNEDCKHDIKLREFLIDQPFRSIWLECSEGLPLKSMRGSIYPELILGIWAHEVDFEHYFCVSLIATYDHSKNGELTFSQHIFELNKDNVYGRISDDRYEVNKMHTTLAHEILFWTFRRFRSDYAFFNDKKRGFSVRVGTGKDREKIKINQIVRIILKKERKYYEKDERGEPIDWTHTWEVRGHWRKIKPGGIGKDRDGVYQVRGMTWVDPFTKGKGELVLKQRLVQNDT